MALGLSCHALVNIFCNDEKIYSSKNFSVVYNLVWTFVLLITPVPLMYLK